MEIRNTPPPASLPEWDDSTLVEELCLALRRVAIFSEQLPDGEKVRREIARVKEINNELQRRGLEISARIARLSRETKWNMKSLLRNTLDYPQTMPYLKRPPRPQCGHCRKWISRRAVLGLCLKCINHGLEQLKAGRSESHLDVCTVCGRREKGFLVYAFAQEWINYCRSCLTTEKARRRAGRKRLW